MIITTLIDNEKENLNLISEHGLSILVELDKGLMILFDTGKSSSFIQNAKLLGKDLSKVDYVVLSHGHYDHTGGLEAFLKINSTAKIVLKREALQDKWSISTGFNREIGFPLKNKIEPIKDRIIYADEILELSDSVKVHPLITKTFEFEATDQVLFLVIGDRFVLDPFYDELFMTISTNQGIIVFTGCAHNGLENIVHSAIDQTADTKIKMVVGGAHIHRALQEQIELLTIRLNTLEIENFAFNHCTGKKNIPFLSSNLNAEVSYLATGSNCTI